MIRSTAEGVKIELRRAATITAYKRDVFAPACLENKMSVGLIPGDENTRAENPYHFRRVRTRREPFNSGMNTCRRRRIGAH
jgi:hypothetical protein